MREFDYDLDYKQLNLRDQPELYRVGRGEQGVLLVEPYKSEILPHWRFATPDVAQESSDIIYQMFLDYLATDDFVGADMARKFLQMGYTRARRYANHKGGKKYKGPVPDDKKGQSGAHGREELPRDEEDPIKAESARIFKQKWDLCRTNDTYLQMKKAHREKYKHIQSMKTTQLERLMTTLTKNLLIFDFDGTLIDSVPDLADAVNDMLTTLGKSTYPIETIRNWVGNGSRLLVERALVGSVSVSEDQLSKDDADHAEQVFFDAYAKISGSKTIAYPDVDAGLKKLHQSGFQLALVTNKPIQFVPKILKSFGWHDLFAEVLGGDSLPVKKPDPAPLRHVCDSLGVNPEQAVMIGDSKNDILAGQNANIDTLGLSYGYNYGQDIRDFNPTATFDDFQSMVDWILNTYS